jgi:glycosyltransferase involved in cell wall biosynthesis
MGIPAEKIEVIHHFYEKKQAPPPPAENGHAMFIGRLSEEKGVMQLLEAWRILNRRDKRLIIVGEGPEAVKLKAFAAWRGLDNVTFTGFLSPQQQADVWAGAAFNIVPSIWMEPFGMVLLETWANNRAVIAHNIGAIPEIATHGQDAWLTEPFKPQLLAEAMDHAFNHPEECKALAASGREKMQRDFTKQRWLDQMTGVYRKMGY